MFKKRDPVCGARVSKNTEYFLCHQGKTYYFDCQACKITFQENVGSYFKKNTGGGFINWIAKGKGSVPKSCHEGRVNK